MTGDRQWHEEEKEETEEERGLKDKEEEDASLHLPLFPLTENKKDYGVL